MAATRWSLVVLSLVLGSTSVRAQDFYYNPYLYDYNAASVAVQYKHAKSRGAMAIGVGGFAIQGLGIAPVYGPFAVPYYGPVINQQVTVVTYRPAPPILLPGPFLVDDLTMAIMPRREAEIPLTPRPLPDRAKPPEADKPKKQPEQMPAPKPAEAPKPPAPDAPRIPHPEAEPRAENVRLIALGKESFADLEYGRAAQRFRQATMALPNDGQAHFLLAQALSALGKYAEAVDAIIAGMDQQPNWPSSNFQPLELYGEHVAFYPEHLRLLEDAVERHPNDDVVLFLYAYQLWFDGRKDEARGMLQRALAAGADRAVIERFLRALPAGGGV